LSANHEAISTPLKEKALHNKAKLAFKGRVKTVASSYPSFDYNQKESLQV